MQPVSDHRNPNLYLQIGAFADRSNAEHLISRLAANTLANAHFSINKDDARPLYRVRIGPISNVDEADRMSEDLALLGIIDSHIVID
jgi:rare lipoprotein A